MREFTSQDIYEGALYINPNSKNCYGRFDDIVGIIKVDGNDVWVQLNQDKEFGGWGTPTCMDVTLAILNRNHYVAWRDYLLGELFLIYAGMHNTPVSTWREASEEITTYSTKELEELYKNLVPQL